MAYGTIDTSDAADAGLFAAPALFITFRETLEAAIIVSVLLGLLDKLNLKHMKRYVWLGVLAGSALCIALGIIFIILINVVLGAVFEDSNDPTAKMVQGVISVIAAVLIAVVAMTIGNVMAINAKYESRLSSQVAETAISRNNILFLSFTAIVREGVETIIFFIGVGAAYPAESLPIPAVVGAVLGVVIGVALYRFGGKLALKLFFRFTLVLLIFIGAGVFTNGMHEIQETGGFGEWDDEDARPPLNRVQWDISECCGLDVNEGWVMFRVLFGYTPNPTGFEILMYLGYHFVCWTALVYRYHNKPRKESGRPALWRALLHCDLNYDLDDNVARGAAQVESETTRPPVGQDGIKMVDDGLNAKTETNSSDGSSDLNGSADSHTDAPINSNNSANASGSSTQALAQV